MKKEKITIRFSIEVRPEVAVFLEALADSPNTGPTTRKAAAQYAVNMFCAGKFKELETFQKAAPVPLNKIGKEKNGGTYESDVL